MSSERSGFLHCVYLFNEQMVQCPNCTPLKQLFLLLCLPPFFHLLRFTHAIAPCNFHCTETIQNYMQSTMCIDTTEFTISLLLLTFFVDWNNHKWSLLTVSYHFYSTKCIPEDKKNFWVAFPTFLENLFNNQHSPQMNRSEYESDGLSQISSPWRPGILEFGVSALHLIHFPIQRIQ